MIDFFVIKDEQLNFLIQKIDQSIVFIKNEFGIELINYEAMLRISFNAIHIHTFNNILERLDINRELERGLDNAGGYTLKYLQNNNPKEDLTAIINFLKTEKLKEKALIAYLQSLKKKSIAIFDINDIDEFKVKLSNSKIEYISYNQLKKNKINKKNLVLYSFNGKKDFDFIDNNESRIMLVIYEHEYNLYQKQIQLRKNLIIAELKSLDRFKICEIIYSEPENLECAISSTLDNLVNRLDDWSDKSYNAYKTECDILLDDIEEKSFYKIKTDKGTFHLESCEILFSEEGNFIKTFKVKIGDKIRIYPKDKLIENLYKVAVEIEPEIFGKIDEYSNYWKECLNFLKSRYSIEQLYKLLKEKGLRVMPATLESYGKVEKKFPMFNNDLKAIFQLYYLDKTSHEIDLILKPILKSKITYNGTMIVLGRALKQDLRLFLKEKKIGQILEKRNFDINTLHSFIEQYMPIHQILDKSVIAEQFELIDLFSHF